MRTAAMLAAGLLITLLLACALFAMGVSTRTVAAPAFNLDLGPFRLVSFTTNAESCARRMLCPIGHIRTSARSFYAVWLMDRAAPGSAQPFSGGRPLLVLRQWDRQRR